MTLQPLASIAKREEWIYVYGQEDEPIVLDKFSPILHLVQTIRDEAHRFAVTFHRTRRNAQRLTSELHDIPGIGPKTVEKLLRTFGSLERVRQASAEELAKAVGTACANRLIRHFANDLTRSPLVQIKKSQTGKQSGKQSDTLGNAVDQNTLVDGVSAFADSTKTV